jgi:hypothetical protein
VLEVLAAARETGAIDLRALAAKLQEKPVVLSWT